MAKILSITWGLAVALCWVLPAAAQLPRLLPPWPGRTAAKTPPRPPVKPGAEDYDRLVEIQVELAWLNEPATFLCPLQASVHQGALLVRGQVPSRSVRERVLKLARLNCPMKIVDGLQVRALPRRTAPLPPDQMQEKALLALQAAFPQLQPFPQVQCDDSGRIWLSGLVRTFEEKLALSRCLRGLDGCTGVVNKVRVTPDIGVLAGAGSKPEPEEVIIGILAPKFEPVPEEKIITLSSNPAGSAMPPAQNFPPDGSKAAPKQSTNAIAEVPVRSRPTLPQRKGNPSSPEPPGVNETGLPVGPIHHRLANDGLANDNVAESMPESPHAKLKGFTQRSLTSQIKPLSTPLPGVGERSRDERRPAHPYGGYQSLQVPVRTVTGTGRGNLPPTPYGAVQSGELSSPQNPANQTYVTLGTVIVPDTEGVPRSPTPPPLPKSRQSP